MILGDIKDFTDNLIKALTANITSSRPAPSTTALPLRARSGKPMPLEEFGITVGEPTPGNPLWHYVTLPEGWSGHVVDHPAQSRRGVVINDQHERPRLIALRCREDSRAPVLMRSHLTDYVHLLAHSDAPLAVDDWAPAEELLRRAHVLLAQAQRAASTECRCGLPLCTTRVGALRATSAYAKLITRVEAARPARTSAEGTS